MSGFAACTGPGLEPPGDDNSTRGGGPIGGMSGTVSEGGAGTGPTGGTGGAFGNAGGAGGAAGTGPLGGSAGTGTGVVGGSGGTGGSPVFDSDAGAPIGTGDGGSLEPTAPRSDCETGRDQVELGGAGDASAACELVLPEAARTQAENMLTVALSTESGTQSPPRVLSALGCLLQGGDGFYVQLDAQGEPERAVLCANSCALAEAGATIELLYGCPTPLP